MATGVIDEGPWAGWTRWGGKPERFGGLVGGHYVRNLDGKVEFAAEPGEQHRNNGPYLHGGYLMSIADQSLFAIARSRLSADTHAVTLTFNSEFLGAAVAGQTITGTGEVLRETGKLIFVRGTLAQEGALILSFSGTLRKVPRKA